MPRPKKPVPVYRLHRQSGQAVATVNLNGSRKDVLLGPHGSPESKEEYERLLARLRAGGPTAALAADNTPDITLAELIRDYIRRCNSLRAAGEPRKVGGTGPHYSLRKVRELYGSLPIVEFGPKALGVVRDAWVADGHCRKVINGRTGAVRRLFKWAVAQELVGVEVYQRLLAVEGLRAGQTTAPDRPPVRPAVMADVEKVLPLLSTTVRALLIVQLHSGSRAGELVKLRVGDIDRTDPDVWSFQPATHKGTWRGKTRAIFFGAKCREALAPLILKAGSSDAYIFSPARSEEERNAERSSKRATKLWPSHARRNEEKRVGGKRKKKPRDCYDTGSFRRAVERACEAVGVPRFTPHRLRHLAATMVRGQLSTDHARALLGHGLASATEVYSREVDRGLALEAVKKLG